MRLGDSGAMPRRVIVIQLAILAGLAVWFKVCLPGIEKSREESQASEREAKIEQFFQSAVVEDRSGQPQAAGTKSEPPAHPQKLRALPSVEEVMGTLGAPDARTTDFQGGLHLTWKGARHSLEASFSKGRLYCLRWEDLQTGHGTLVFESSLYWHPF